jgi:hypothetical protein
MPEKTIHHVSAVAADSDGRGHKLNWDFLQRYDESWIWRCADRRQVTESTRNFAVLEECIEDAARHGYVADSSGRGRKRNESTGAAMRTWNASGSARTT